MHIRGRTLTSKRSNTLRFGHARLRESVRTLHVFSVVHFAPISVSLLLRRISGATQTLREQSGREWRSLHIEAQLRNDLGIRKILPTALSLTENTFRRWLKRLAEEAVLKLEKQEGDCAVSAPHPRKSEKRRAESRISAGSRSARRCAIEPRRRSGRCLSRPPTGAEWVSAPMPPRCSCRALAAQMGRSTGRQEGHYPTKRDAVSRTIGEQGNVRMNAAQWLAWKTGGK